MKKSNDSLFLEEGSRCKSNCHHDNRNYCFPPEVARALVTLSTPTRDPRDSASGSVTSDIDDKSKWQDQTKEGFNADEEKDGIPTVNGLRGLSGGGGRESEGGDVEEESKSEAEDTGRCAAIGHEARWEVMYDRLVAYKEKHGHCLVPNRHKEDFRLGSWVSTQRRQRKALLLGRFDATTLSTSRIQRLDAIGFAWHTSDPRRAKWDAYFQHLKRPTA